MTDPVRPKQSEVQRCRCRAHFFFAITEPGNKPIPIDLDPADDGSVVLHRDAADPTRIVARTPTLGQLAGMRAAGYETWNPHFRDCPLAEAYRNKKRKGRK